MPLPSHVIIGVTSFDEVFETLNQVIDNVPDNADFDGQTLALNNGATQLFSVDLTKVPDARLSGLTFSNTALAVSYTAGSYVYNGVQFNPALGNFNLTSPTDSRIDLVIGDATGNIVVIEGTDSPNPVAPTLTGGTLLQTYYVQSATLVFGDQLSVPPAPDDYSNQAIEIETRTADATLSNLSKRTQIFYTGCATLTLPANPLNGRYFIFKNRSGGSVTIARNGKNIDGVAADVTLLNGEFIQLFYSTVTGDWSSIS